MVWALSELPAMGRLKGPPQRATSKGRYPDQMTAIYSALVNGWAVIANDWDGRLLEDGASSVDVIGARFYRLMSSSQWLMAS